MIRCEQSSKNSPKRRFTMRPALWIVLLLGVLLAAPGVFAQTNVDFFCNLAPGSTCTGTVTHSGSNFSSSGINVFNDSGPFSIAVPFTLAFNTATKSISLDGTGVDAGINLVGTIVSYMGIGSSVGLTANFTSLPASVQAQLGTATGSSTGFVIYIAKNGTAQSVDLLIAPTPEPTSMLLVGTGLLAIGGLLRKRRTPATT